MTIDLKAIIGPAAAKKSVTQLTADRERLVTDHESAKALVADMKKRRKAILLAGDDKAAEQHDAELGKASREADRLEAAIEHLDGLIEKARVREEEEAKELERAAIKHDIERAKELADDYDRHAVQIAKILGEVERLCPQAIASLHIRRLNGHPGPIGRLHDDVVLPKSIGFGHHWHSR